MLLSVLSSRGNLNTILHALQTFNSSLCSQPVAIKFIPAGFMPRIAYSRRLKFYNGNLRLTSARASVTPRPRSASFRSTLFHSYPATLYSACVYIIPLPPLFLSLSLIFTYEKTPARQSPLILPDKI